jgi:hypothetical protein
VGRENLAEAVSWVTDQIWNDEQNAPSTLTCH